MKIGVVRVIKDEIEPIYQGCGAYKYCVANNLMHKVASAGDIMYFDYDAFYENFDKRFGKGSADEVIHGMKYKENHPFTLIRCSHTLRQNGETVRVSSKNLLLVRIIDIRFVQRL